MTEIPSFGIVGGPKAFITPAPRPKSTATHHDIVYNARGTVRFAYQILINIAMADFVVSIKYLPDIDHCNVILRVPEQHLAWVKKTLGLPD